MEHMDPETCLLMDDDFLNFGSDIGEEDDDDDKNKATSPSSLESNLNSGEPDDQRPSFHESGEEDHLEWLSNKDAFPGVETCFNILPDNLGIPVPKSRSPVSVLDSCSSRSNSNSNGSSITSCCGSILLPVAYPVRARSKRRRKRRSLPIHQCQWLSQAANNNNNNARSVRRPEAPIPRSSSSATGGGGGAIGRRCQHCLAEKTPQWRAGPMGPKTLCNACGVRYKSGRLVPEYRPASSPTFSSVLHSNSHRKVMEMRRQKMGGGGMVGNEHCGYSSSNRGG